VTFARISFLSFRRTVRYCSGVTRLDDLFLVRTDLLTEGFEREKVSRLDFRLPKLAQQAWTRGKGLSIVQDFAHT